MAGKAVGATVERIGRMPRYNNTARVRECQDMNRTTEAGNRDEVEGVMANTPNLSCDGATLLAKAFGVVFID
jgi:hypothetical protein